MVGLVPTIHDFFAVICSAADKKSWMPVTSTGMTVRGN